MTQAARPLKKKLTKKKVEIIIPQRNEQPRGSVNTSSKVYTHEFKPLNQVMIAEHLKKLKHQQELTKSQEKMILWTKSGKKNRNLEEQFYASVNQAFLKRNQLDKSGYIHIRNNSQHY